MKKVLVGLTLVLAGCGSVPDVGTAPNVAASEIVDKSVLAPHVGASAVIVKRDSWPGHAYRLGVYSDGNRIATIGDGEVLTVYLAQGRRLIGVGRLSSSKPDAETGVDVKQDKKAFVHLTLSAWGWGGWNISPSSY